MLKNASLRLLRGSCQVWPKVPLVGYSKNVPPLIHSFCSATIESLTCSKVDGEFPDEGEADLLYGSSDSDSEPSHGNAARREFKEEKLKRGDETEAYVSVSRKGHYHQKESIGLGFRPFLFQLVLHTPGDALRTVLDKWIKDGNLLERNEVLMVLFHLRKQRQYQKALQFMEWIERGKLLNFEEHDYACYLDLIARNSGIQAAQKYIKRVPKPFRNVVLYETLLVNCVCLNDVQKAEEVFKEIRSLHLPLTVCACNQMILLYKRLARIKVADIIMLMEQENIKPSPITYKLLIGMKGQSNDTLGMESILNTMKANGVEPGFSIWTMAAKFYISWGLLEKAEEIIRAVEVHAEDKRHAIRSLLDLYAVLGRPDDVARIWKSCTEPKLDDFLAAIKAWGKLGHIEEAEETFEVLLKAYPKLTSKYFNAMLNVYAENKCLSKGKELLERMCFAGCPNSPLTWDALVSLYVNSGNVEKADTFLLNVTEENPDRNPLFASYVRLLKAYAAKGDIHNSEKIFHIMKQIRYPGRVLPYGFLLDAYVNAKVPPHGFRERMKADNVHPNKYISERLTSL